MAASVKHLHVMKKVVSALFCVYQTQPTRGLLRYIKIAQQTIDIDSLTKNPHRDLYKNY